jgi:hypothetical protein
MSLKVSRRLLNEADAAEYLSRTVEAMKKLRYRGYLRFVKIGKRIQYDLKDLDDFINEHKIRIDY